MRAPAARSSLGAGVVCAFLVLSACASTQEEEAEAAPAAASDEQPAAAAAPASEIERQPWNAEEMTRLTADLAQSIRDIRQAWRKEPVFRDPNSPNRRSALQLDQTLRALDQRTTQLAARVKDGGGYDDTLNIARNIRVLLNDVDVLSRRIMSSVWMEERVRPAMGLINEIAAYYGSDALFDTETLQRTDRPERVR